MSRDKRNYKAEVSLQDAVDEQHRAWKIETLTFVHRLTGEISIISTKQVGHWHSLYLGLGNSVLSGRLAESALQSKVPC